MKMNNPCSFISYAWESDELKNWVKELGSRLRNDGVDVKLDQWEVVPGDQIPHFMETSVKGNDYVLIVCTPTYKLKSENREGGVGYEGDIMTAEVFENSNHRKFIPILKSGTKETSIPLWLKGKYFIDFLTNERLEDNYDDLITTLFNVRETAPPIGKPPKRVKEKIVAIKESSTDDEAIKIKGILVDEVTEPRNDGTRGSALYQVPFELNTRPSYEWIDLFINAWNHPSRFTSMHRPGIASVIGNKVLLNGTTIEEVAKYHKDTLKLALSTANDEFKRRIEQRKAQEQREQLLKEEHRKRVDDISKGIDFE